MKKEQKRKRSKEEKGITLIALVITIILLLILAGVTLNAALSENGLFKKAKYAAEEYNEKAIEEKLQLILAEKELESVSNGTNQKADITSVLEEVAGEGGITEEEIKEFNEKYLQDYDEKIEAVKPEDNLKNKIEENPDGFYVQTGNITIPEDYTPLGGATLDENENLIPNNPFTGVYDGNGYTINDLNITATGHSAGMFGYNKGTIKNVTIDNCNINGDEYRNVGAIAGTNSGVIENCTVRGTITASNNYEADELGGICGELNGGLIKNCTNYATINARRYNVGGICGEIINNGNIEDCSNNGNVSGLGQVGGIVGNIGGYAEENGGYVRRCVNKSNITELDGEDDVSKVNHVGGICGKLHPRLFD